MKMFKVGRVHDLPQFLSRSAKKFGELWSTNCKDLDVESYPPKLTFLKDHISAPTGCCATKFLHALENDQVLLGHPPLGTGDPLQFFSKGVQNWLKFQQVCFYR